MTRAALLLTLCLLSACAGGQGAIVSNPLLAPPWEALVRAGPGAENEIDLETLNGPEKTPAQQPPTDIAAAPPETAAPVEPAPPKKSQDPDAVAIKAVAVPPVKGGNAKGNGELTFAMRDALQKAGWPVLEQPRSDAISIEGSVKVSKPKDGKQQVTLIWEVKTPQGRSLGDLRQSNEVPAGSLEQGWGENAEYATQAAAEGIFKLIEKYR